MRIYDLETSLTYQDNSILIPDGTVCALGNFDGVHLGHKALLEKTVQLAHTHHAIPAVWTFTSHPFSSHLKLLTSEEDRFSLFAACGIRYVITEEYDDVKDLSVDEFAKEILIGRCHASACVCGFNFSCGKGGCGNADMLGRALSVSGVSLSVVSPVMVGGETVSSTRIRRALDAGDMRSAADCLGRLYSFSLPVLHGKELGRTIGVPTANQIFFSGMQIPGVGTYASTVRLGDTLYPGVTNIGYRPSVEDGSAPLLNAETHIIGYEGDLYGKELRVGIRFRLRNETKFPSLDALANQIRVDISRSLEDFQKEGGWGLCL